MSDIRETPELPSEIWNMIGEFKDAIEFRDRPRISDAMNDEICGAVGVYWGNHVRGGLSNGLEVSIEEFKDKRYLLANKGKWIWI